ncbi:MAG TPA: hypothetical protein VJ981_01915 [Gammaproteobacteria bacterium]|nr:hypothetical protein [Gammaproteobacteria bacterium]
MIRTLYRLSCVFFLYAWLQPAPAVEQVRINLGRVEFNTISAEKVSAELDYGTGEAVSLRITAGQLLLPDSVEFEQLEIDCQSGSLTNVLLRCENGSFQINYKDHGKITGNINLVYYLDGSMGKATLNGIAIGDSDIAANAAFDVNGWYAGIKGHRLDLAWLRKTLEPYGFWPAEYSDESGNLDIDMQASGEGNDIHNVQGLLQAHNVSFYGTNAAEDFSGKVNFAIDKQSSWQIRADGNLENGVLFVQPGMTVGNIQPGITLEVTEHPVNFVIDTTLNDSLRAINVRQLDIDQPGVMTAHVQADAELDEEFKINNTSVSLNVADSARFYGTWLQPFLLETQFNAMETAGSLQAEAGIHDNELRHLTLQFDDVHAYDGNKRFYVAGLEGTLRINEAGTPVSSMLSWDGAGIYRLDTGAARLALESSNQELTVTSWEDVPLLGGDLHIDTLNITNAGKRDMTIRLDGELTPIAMADFTRAMGLPIMSGELTAAIEGLIYNRGKLVVNGEINIGLFGGNVIVRNLSIDDLFGLVPVLHTDIDIQQALDLELLTNRFSFGSIEGRLGGRIHKLELQAWQPVYFEAELMTPENDTSRHRISQQAVDNLGYLGGGAVNVLSRGFLRFFKEYSYGELGISCRLFNGVCQLGGVSETADGFVIVSRGGFLPPWIEVIGTGHSIAWPVLIEGLKTITTNKPQIK